MIKFIKSFLHLLPKQQQQQQQSDSCPFPRPVPPQCCSPPSLTTRNNNNINKKSDKNIKVIKSDGVITIYDRPINVSQLILDHPDYLVCHSDSIYIGRKIPSLSQDHKLQPGHNYFLLPQQIFQSALSFLAFASFATHPLNKAAAALCKPFNIYKTDSGFLKVQVTDHFISLLLLNQQQKGKHDDADHDNSTSMSVVGLLCTTPQLDKDYKQLRMMSSRNWKPKLETIRETRKKKKFSSFRIRMMKKFTKKKTKTGSTSPRILRSEHRHVSSTRAVSHFSMSKFKFRSRK